MTPHLRVLMFQGPTATFPRILNKNFYHQKLGIGSPYSHVCNTRPVLTFLSFLFFITENIFFTMDSLAKRRSLRDFLQRVTAARALLPTNHAQPVTPPCRS